MLKTNRLVCCVEMLFAWFVTEVNGLGVRKQHEWKFQSMEKELLVPVPLTFL